MQDGIGKTPLNEWHRNHGANMADFRGWDMPLWFPSGAVTEHQRVITHAGLFDTSHMAAIMVTGPDAYDLLQHCFSKDLSACVGSGDDPLTPGRAVFGAYLDENGYVLDDSVVFQTESHAYMAIVNAGMGAMITRHLVAHSTELHVETVDLTGQLGKLDLQGPNAAKILIRCLKDPEMTLGDMSYYSFRGHFRKDSAAAFTCTKDGVPILLSRTGYSGEFGFEIFVEPDSLVQVWDMLLSEGEEFGLIPCGLAARDSLRTGACLPLSQQDFGPWPFVNHPWDIALPFNKEGTAFTKDFIGSHVLDLKDSADHTYPFVGYDPRKVSIHDPACVLDEDGNEIGRVLTCVADMAIGRHEDRIFSIGSPDKPDGFKPRGLNCGFVKVKSPMIPGQVVALKDKRRTLKVMITDQIRPDLTARRPMNEMI